MGDSIRHLRRLVAVVVLAAALLAPAAALAHPDHGGQTAVPLPAPTAPQPEDDGGTSGLMVAAVAIGLVGLGVTLGALKRMQSQKEQSTRLSSAAPSA